MTSSTEKIVIVVPCYNEADRLPVEVFRSFREIPNDLRFLFVNDGSTDETEEIINKLASEDPNRFSAHSLAQNSGKAEAVRQGLLLALRDEADFVGFWDADLATPLDEIPRFLQAIRDQPELDMAIGSRVSLLGRKINRKRSRHYIGRAFATVASLWLGIGIYDTQCGAKLLRNTSVIRKVLSKRFQAKWLFDVEILARYLQLLHRRGIHQPENRIVEIPLHRWEDVKGSKVKATDFPKAIGELIGLMRAYNPRA
ncbi:MAG: glycosyltransferase [Candidatus Sumerlaeia bacterium]|nr:glycosyltransferase [Candidatus Sumerlaeia bacterium]